MATKNLPALVINKSLMLPDNDQWQFRFEVNSETSGNIYVISQNKKRRHWACSCMGFRAHRKCKHLQALGLPIYEQPHEVQIITR
jgi:hypothetical protein